MQAIALWSNVAIVPSVVVRAVRWLTHRLPPVLSGLAAFALTVGAALAGPSTVAGPPPPSAQSASMTAVVATADGAAPDAAPDAGADLDAAPDADADLDVVDSDDEVKAVLSPAARPAGHGAVRGSASTGHRPLSAALPSLGQRAPPRH